MIGRLRGRRAFEDLRRHGRTVRGSRLVIRFRAIDDGVFVGYAMPRRLGPAVVRNRLRRQLRAVFEMMARDDDLRLRDGLYLVRAENAAVGSDLTVLRDEVSGLLDELHQVRAR